MLVPDLAGGPRLVDEPPPERLVGRELGPQDLQGDLVALRFADGAEDDAHPALEPFLEAVDAEPRAWFEIRHARRIVRFRVRSAKVPIRAGPGVLEPFGDGRGHQGRDRARRLPDRG